MTAAITEPITARTWRFVIVLVAAAACGRPDAIPPSPPSPMPARHTIVLDQTPKERRQMVPAEVILRAYLTWFGGLAPSQVVQRAHGANLFDQWSAYLAALGLPDHHVDAPRVSQSNTVMLAALGRLGEALCVRSAEHDLHAHPPLDTRVVFAFEPVEGPTREQFASGFDVLHRTFLGYPAHLAPEDRLDRYYALYRQVVARHRDHLLSPDETGWVAVCAALVQHPEAGVY
jgi:hypothetical protein